MLCKSSDHQSWHTVAWLRTFTAIFRPFLRNSEKGNLSASSWYVEASISSGMDTDPSMHYI